MERSRKLTLTDRTKADNALFLHFEGNKSKLAKHLNKKSRTTITAFFDQKPLSEPEFRKICLALRLNWQEVSAVDAIEPKQENWIEEVRSRCCEKILYQHGTIQLLNQAEIEVDQLYVDVWLLDRSPRTFQVSESTMLRSFDLRNDRLGLGDRIKRNEGMEIANKDSKLLILGKPGAGKTTFLKHLAVDCSKGRFQADLIPVLIELRRIRSDEWKLLDAISEELKLDNQQTQTLLEQGKLLILMDGLDEVPTSNFRRTVQDQIRNLAQDPKHSDNRFILTCRTQIIEVIPQGFVSVEVADFNKEQVKKFVENWFCASGLTEVDITQQWQRFSDAMEKNPALKELTVTPVLLSLMCLVLQDEGDLPTQAALLYRKGIRLLLEKWNDRKEIPEWKVEKQVYRNLTFEQKEELLIAIAGRKFENPGNFVLFEQADLVQQISHFLKLTNHQDGEIVLRSIEAQHGVLVERADQLWSFSHLTFQEYFTGQWLIQAQEDEILANKIADQGWRHIARMSVQAMMQPADIFLLRIKKAVDRSIANYPQLQGFLSWVQQNSNSDAQSCYKPAAIRAFYFDRVIDSENDLTEFLTRYLDRAVESALDCINHNHQNLLVHHLDSKFPIDRSLARARILEHMLEITLKIAIDMAAELASQLQRLRNELPDASEANWQEFQLWWKNEGSTWIEALRQVINRHRDIGHDWQFTNQQKQQLQRYYDANNFLIELLKQPGVVSDQVRQEIEDNLLLPIAELKRRLPDQYS